MNSNYGLHYHNSLKTSGPGFNRYTPNTEIITDPLTDKYAVGEQIGRGKFAVVKKCTNHETKEVVAAKFIKKRRRGKTCRDEILREVVMLEMALDHPRLVNLKEVYETQSELILITEYCAGGELFTECIIEDKFPECDVRLLMSQILEGITYLHEKSIVHLDLKPQNILLTEAFPKGSVKICDLGFACLVNTGEDIRDIIGTPDYVAPEVLNYDPLGLYTDMWSLGVLTYVMLTQCSPFAGDDKQETFCNITTVQLDFPEDLFTEVSAEAKDFIKKLLLANPEERMTAKDCLKHPWITGSLSPTSGLSTEEVESVNDTQGTSGSQISNSFLDHSMVENQRTGLIGNADSHSPSGQEDTHQLNMTTNDSNRSVSPKTSDLVSGENGTDKNVKELTVEEEPGIHKMEDYGNQNETEIDMETKSEIHSKNEAYNNMEISFTKEDIEKNESEDSICKRTNYVDNLDAEMRSRSMSETEASLVKELNSSNLENVLHNDSSVEIIVNNGDVGGLDVEMVNSNVLETDAHSDSGSDSVTPTGSSSKGSNSTSSGSACTLCETSSTTNVKTTENPYKRGMCNESSPSAISTLNSNEKEDEIDYEFISVSKRVRNYEQSLTPQRSPQISPKSPRSPRVRRLQLRTSLHNTPKSS